MKEIFGKSVLLLGYGREGRSTHTFLRARYPEMIVGVADKDQSLHIEGINEARLHKGDNYLKSVFDYDVVVRSPGISPYLPEFRKAQREGKWITSATNIFFSECPGMIIGVTGTKGKSTTTSLIYEIVKKEYSDVRLVGNIGRPALDYLNGADINTIFVSELSSHQLEDIRYSPHVAVLLNIVPEHLDYYPSFEDYAKAKNQIVHYQGANDIVVFNPTHKILIKILDKIKSQELRFSLNPSDNLFCWIDGKKIYTSIDGSSSQVMPLEEIPLLGKGNYENTLAAISTGLALGVSRTSVREAVKGFKSLEHRLELVGKVKGIEFYNDSLATIPQATMHALEALGPKVETLIAGGFDRGLEFGELGSFLSKQKGLRNLILFPDTGSKIWDSLLHAGKSKRASFNKYEVKTMEEAVEIAFKVTNPGKACLMSPASASFNLFKDYSERGDTFKKLVLSRML
ncbi:UDP-N-acetylmuramoylalanine--D-glutamate ligase [Candidatus Woesebacteria bacterium RIFOXYA1_FULL_40_18]|uniref:UDP-N-acetylmuramoylalanine--D-glutamate ligase n=1 Tax=Candidatus Woesebacteria bacterium RIFOXYA1_FULL_40_18 TaxID=1802532 RepID=A0A1F8CKD5_9BACT|nr:MAG: UDP-N-acetylmuramoylalanine--D-glutamate ligase [Candidatus Woesebacteria bacterium RIFOXYA1_FULL_40_18]